MTTYVRRSYIQKQVDDVNEGFKNSNIPLKAVIHCIRQSKITEARNSNAPVLRIFFESESKLIIKAEQIAIVIPSYN